MVLIGSFFIPESPRFFYEKKRYLELRELIRKFAKSNNVIMDHDYDIDKEVEEENQQDDEDLVEVPSKSFYLKQPRLVMNLVMVIICFISVSFNSYLIGFHLKYIKGNLYFLALIQTISDVSATLVSGGLQKILTTRRTLLVSYVSALLFGIPLVLAMDAKWIIPVCIFGSKFGLAVGFNMIYFVNAEIFPTLFVSFAFTIGNMFSRSATILAPQVAELDEPVPMQIFCVLCLIASCATFFIRHTQDVEKKQAVRKTHK